MRKIFIMAICFLLSSCASNNKNILNKNSEHYGKSFVKYNFNNLYLEKVNGKKYKQNGPLSFKQEGMYVNPGYTTVEIRHKYSDQIKKLCFIAKRGDTVSITLYPKSSNQYTYPYAVFTLVKSPFGPIKDPKLGIACRK